MVENRDKNSKGSGQVDENTPAQGEQATQSQAVEQMPEKEFENDDSTMKRISSKRGILSALTALALVISVPAIVGAAGLGIISLSVITQGWFAMYSTLALMAAVRLFGKDTLESVREAKGGE